MNLNISEHFRTYQNYQARQPSEQQQREILTPARNRKEKIGFR